MTKQQPQRAVLASLQYGNEGLVLILTDVDTSVRLIASVPYSGDGAAIEALDFLGSHLVESLFVAVEASNEGQ